MIRVAGALPLADRFAVRASVAYKGAGCGGPEFRPRRGRAAAYAAAEAWLARVASSIEPGKPLEEQLAVRLKALPGAALRNGWRKAAIGSYPLEPSPMRRPAGSFLVLTVELSLDGMPWLGATPAFVA